MRYVCEETAELHLWQRQSQEVTWQQHIHSDCIKCTYSKLGISSDKLDNKRSTYCQPMTHMKEIIKRLQKPSSKFNQFLYVSTDSSHCCDFLAGALLLKIYEELEIFVPRKQQCDVLY